MVLHMFLDMTMWHEIKFVHNKWVLVLNWNFSILIFRQSEAIGWLRCFISLVTVLS